MPMPQAVSVLVRGIVKSMKYRLVFNKDLYSARCFSSLSLKPFHKFSSGAPWDDLYADDLVIIAELLEECVRRLLTWKEKNGEERAESKCRKYKDHDLRYTPGPPAEFRRVPMRCLSHYVQ